MTTDDNMGKPVFWLFNTYLRKESQRAEEFGIFIVKTITADGSLLSPTGSVKGMNPAPHIHAHLRYTIVATALAYTFTHDNITLEHTAMNDKNTIAHTDAYNTQF